MGSPSTLHSGKIRIFLAVRLKNLPAHINKIKTKLFKTNPTKRNLY